MTVKEIITELRTVLTPAVGEREASAMAEIIVEDTTGRSRTAILLRPESTITDESLERIRQVEQRVLNGEPVQYALGQAMFRGRMFGVREGVLIPRPETAQLVDMVVDDNEGRADLRVLDVGTGTGCIACSIARDLLFPEVTATDVSAVAVEQARANARALDVRVEVVKADILDYSASLPGTGDYDIVVSNPPYVMESERAEMDARVVDHEPSLALFVPDSDPLIFYRTIAKKSWTRMPSGGKIYFEINPLCAGRLVALMQDIGYQDVTLARDYCGRERFLKCRRP